MPYSKNLHAMQRELARMIGEADACGDFLLGAALSHAASIVDTRIQAVSP